MPRYRVTLEYDGTRYAGWQVQKGVKTVQGVLIEAARRSFGEVGEVMGSGRTDAGVHARGQVAHIDLVGSIPNERVVRGLNEFLPHDVNVLAARSVDRRFHARHDAIERSYIYQISRRRTAFAKSYVWWIRDRLDVGAVRRAAISLVGMHDFVGFTDQGPEEGDTRVHVTDLTVGEFGPLVVVRVRGSHFLRKMVRRMVWGLAEVGRGAMDPSVLSEAIERPGSIRLTQTAPPSGLFLEGVAYPGEALQRDVVPIVHV